MDHTRIKILAIETSCDETAAAVIGEENDAPVILSNIVSSQADLHAKTGGIVPEVASRAHMEAIIPVITQALQQAKYQISHSSLSLRAHPSESKTNISPSLSARRAGGKYQNEGIDYNNAISFLKKDIDYIAVTVGPGLIGSLLVGYNAAKTLAYVLDKPIIPVNHIEGHIYSAFGGENSKLETRNSKNDPKNVSDLVLRASDFPLIALTVSGGHTSLTLMHDHGCYENLGQTIDDAAGEAFDKVAKLLDLGYPGGPRISEYASRFRDNLKFKISNLKLNENSKTCPELVEGLKIENSMQSIVFPRPILNDGTFNFSFSGLKTAVLQKVTELKKSVISSHREPTGGWIERGEKSQHDGTDEVELSLDQKQEIAAAFEDAIVDVLTTKTLRAVEKYQPKIVILAGGVAANKYLREQLSQKMAKSFPEIQLIIPPFSLCGDNAAMIGTAAFYHIARNDISSWDNIKVDSNLEL
jgi:N6-L-threonylcarbamoyladenine synthase